MKTGFVETACLFSPRRKLALAFCLLLIGMLPGALAWSGVAAPFVPPPIVLDGSKSADERFSDCTRQWREERFVQEARLKKLKRARSLAIGDEALEFVRKIQIVVESIVRVNLRIAYCSAMFAIRDEGPAVNWDYFDHPVLDYLGEEGVTRTFYDRFAATTCDECRDELKKLNDWIYLKYQSVLLSQLLWGPRSGPHENTEEARRRFQRYDQDLANFEAELAQRVVPLRNCEKKRCGRRDVDDSGAPADSVAGAGQLSPIPGGGAPGQTPDCPDTKCKQLEDRFAHLLRSSQDVAAAIDAKEQEIADLNIDLRGSRQSNDGSLQKLLQRRDAAYADLVEMHKRQSELKQEMDSVSAAIIACRKRACSTSDNDAQEASAAMNAYYFSVGALKDGMHPGAGGPVAPAEYWRSKTRYPIGDRGAGTFDSDQTDEVRDAIANGDAEPSVKRSSQRNPTRSNEVMEARWGRARVGLSDALLAQIARRNPSPTLVAVIDSGVDIGHRDIAAAIWNNADERFDGLDNDRNGLIDDIYGWNFVDHNAFVMDDNGHGTLVAGIIASRGQDDGGIAGINPWATILPLKVTNSNGEGGSVGVAAAITHAVNRGARIINVSLGGDEFAAAEEVAINHALEKDVLVIVAAGNGSANTQNFWPAGIAAAVTVAASDPDDSSAAYSNFGSAVDIAAPGTNIMSLRAAGTDVLASSDPDYRLGANVRGGDGHLYVTSGTSFAAPHVAGVASLLLSINPQLSATQVRNMLLQSARDIEAPGVDSLSGYGRLDAAAALAADPDYYIEALISGVSAMQQDGEVIVVINGTATADRFDSAIVEMGRGEAPDVWEQVQSPLKTPARYGALAQLPAQNLREAQRWTLRLTVFHSDGSSREARFDLSLK